MQTSTLEIGKLYKWIAGSPHFPQTMIFNGSPTKPNGVVGFLRSDSTFVLLEFNESEFALNANSLVGMECKILTTDGRVGSILLNCDDAIEEVINAT